MLLNLFPVILHSRAGVAMEGRAEYVPLEVVHISFRRKRIRARCGLWGTTEFVACVFGAGACLEIDCKAR